MEIPASHEQAVATTRWPAQRRSLAAAGLAMMALPLGFAGLCAGFLVAGLGSSLQHRRGSLLVTALTAALVLPLLLGLRRYLAAASAT